MIETRLRRHVEAIAPPLELEVIRARATSVDPLGRPHARALLVSAGIAVLAAGAIAVSALRSPDEVIVTAPGTSVALGAWEQVPDAAGVFVPSDAVDTFETEGGSTIAPSAVLVTDVIEHRSALYAVGSVRDGGHSDAAVWLWTDGSWTSVESPAFEAAQAEQPDGPSGFEMFRAASTGDRLTVLGWEHTGGRPDFVTWSSTDGRSWTRHDRIDDSVGDAIVSFTGLTAVNDQFVVVGIDNGDLDTNEDDRSFVARSADGIEWERLDPGTLTPAGALVNGVTSLGDRLLAYGTAGEPRFGRGAAWASDDAGSTWVSAELPTASLLDAEQVVDAVVSDDGVVLIGQARRGDASWEMNDGVVTAITGHLDVVAWVSGDGREFLPVDTSMINTAGIDTLTAAASGPAGVAMAVQSVSLEGTRHAVWTWDLESGFVAQDAVEPGAIGNLGALESGYIAFASDTATKVPRPAGLSSWWLPASD
jgi:hypothetical protein